jgi:hypothetical protein
MRKVNLLVDAGYAYDFLAILEVKTMKLEGKAGEQAQEAFSLCMNYLIEQLEDDFYPAYSSEEYESLYEVNLALFNLVDEIKRVKTDALEVDKLVYKRYLAKKALQDKFFGGNFSEQKIGYTNPSDDG